MPAGSTVLDVGCGGGLFLALLAHGRRIRSGVGFDCDAAVIRLADCAARQLAAAGQPDCLRFLRLDVADPWPAGQFDVVSVIDVVHHVPREAQRRVLTLAAERVRPGGRLLYKDMCRRPRWRALANRLHDLVLSRQWIRYLPVSRVEQVAAGCGLRLVHAERINRLWYGHELRVFERPA